MSDFNESEKGTDQTFNDFPNAIKEIALKKIAMSNNKSELIINLDNCDELRDLTQTPNGKYIKEVDAIVRYYEFINKH